MVSRGRLVQKKKNKKSVFSKVVSTLCTRVWINSILIVLVVFHLCVNFVMTILTIQEPRNSVKIKIIRPNTKKYYPTSKLFVKFAFEKPKKDIIPLPSVLIGLIKKWVCKQVCNNLRKCVRVPSVSCNWRGCKTSWSSKCWTVRSCPQVCNWVWEKATG